MRNLNISSGPSSRLPELFTNEQISGMWKKNYQHFDKDSWGILGNEETFSW